MHFVSANITGQYEVGKGRHFANPERTWRARQGSRSPGDLSGPLVGRKKQPMLLKFRKRKSKGYGGV